MLFYVTAVSLLLDPGVFSIHIVWKNLQFEEKKKGPIYTVFVPQLQLILGLDKSYEKTVREIYLELQIAGTIL